MEVSKCLLKTGLEESKDRPVENHNEYDESIKQVSPNLHAWIPPRLLRTPDSADFSPQHQHGETVPGQRPWFFPRTTSKPLPR
jgi:hypothetical protein